MSAVVLLAPGVQPEMRAAVESKYETFDMTGYERPQDVPGLDPSRVRALVTKGESLLGADLMDALPNLEIIGNFGVGYDGIDVAAAKERGVMVTHTPGVLTDDTANMALALALAVTRRIPSMDAFVRTGRWPSEPVVLGSSIVDKTAGILGLGKIGSGIARRVEACGARVAYHDRKKLDVSYDFYPTPVQLAEASDILFVATYGGASTRNLVDAEVLTALGPQGYLVNAARGSIVEEAALMEALREGRIAGAGLDVFEDEPHVPEGLRAMSNVVLTPHVGSGTHETRRRMAELNVANLDRHFAGEPVLTPVPELADRAS